MKVDIEQRYSQIGNQKKTLTDLKDDANDAFEKAEKIFDSIYWTDYREKDVLKMYLGLGRVVSDENLGQNEFKMTIEEIDEMLRCPVPNLVTWRNAQNVLKRVTEELIESGFYQEINRLVQNYRNAHDQANELRSLLSNSENLSELVPPEDALK